MSIFKQLVVDCLVRGVDGAVLAGSLANSHDGVPLTFHDSLNILKITVHDSSLRDDVRNALHALSQHVVDELVCVVHHGILVFQGLVNLLVGNDDERIHLLPEFSHAGLGILHSPLCLKFKWSSHNGNSERANIAGNFCHDRSRASSRTATHAGGDEHHVGTAQKLADLVLVLVGSLLADLRLSSRTKPFRRLLPKLQAHMGL